MHVPVWTKGQSVIGDGKGGDSLLRIFNVKVACKSKFDQDEECR